MTFVYIAIQIFTTEPFLHASREQLGTWLLLYGYCAGHENGGRIKNCRNWAPGTWMKITGADTPADCPLWLWHDDDLVLIGYDRKNEALAQRKRKGGKLGAKRRWNISPEGLAHETPEQE